MLLLVCFANAWTSTGVSPNTHQFSQRWFKNTDVLRPNMCAYLELHDEMCEVEFSLQVESDADVLLSCGGNVCHSESQQHNRCKASVESD